MTPTSYRKESKKSFDKSNKSRSSFHSGTTSKKSFADGKILHLVQAKYASHATESGRILIPRKAITVISQNGVLVPIKGNSPSQKTVGKVSEDRYSQRRRSRRSIKQSVDVIEK